MSTTDLHDDMIVFDGLNVSNWSRAVFEDMRKGGVTAANCTCSVPYKRLFGRYVSGIFAPIRDCSDVMFQVFLHL